MVEFGARHQKSSGFPRTVARSRLCITVGLVLWILGSAPRSVANSKELGPKRSNLCRAVEHAWWSLVRASSRVADFRELRHRANFAEL